MVNWLAAPGLTVKVLLAAELMPLAEAVNCLFVPVTSISRLVNTAVPLPAPLPISAVVVPWSGPVPALKLIATMKQLESLELGNLPMTEDRIAQMRAFAFLKSLRLVQRPQAYPADIQARIRELL